MQAETPISIPPAATDRVVWRAELREICGNVCSETIRLWIKSGRLPPPDVQLSLKTKGWTASALRRAGIPIPEMNAMRAK